MKSLAALLLVAYYVDMKRYIPARVSRKLDADIRALGEGDTKFNDFVRNCKNVAAAQKAKERRATVRHLQHVPCRRK